MTGDEFLSSVGAVIRFHRRRARLSQLELAQLAGVGKTVVFDLEKGKRSVRLDVLLRVLDTLNVGLDWASPLRAAFEREAHDEARTHPGAR